MIGTRAAARYAKAMLEISIEKGNSEAINSDMILISQSIAESNELKTFLLNPTVKDEIKINALLEVFATTNEVTKDLFKLLSTNSRFEILDGIASEFKKQYESYKGIERVLVTTAIPMDATLEAKVIAKIKSLAPNKEIIISNIVEPGILG